MRSAALIEKPGGWTSIPAKWTSVLKLLAELLENRFLNFAFLFLNILVLNGEGILVPAVSEYVYLPHLVKQYHPSYLLNDWTMSRVWPEHFLFDSLFGTLALLFPLEAVGWLGRIVCWLLLVIGLFRLGRHFQIPRWMITLSIWLWLIYHQSIV